MATTETVIMVLCLSMVSIVCVCFGILICWYVNRWYKDRAQRHLYDVIVKSNLDEFGIEDVEVIKHPSDSYSTNSIANEQSVFVESVNEEEGEEEEEGEVRKM